MNFIDIQNINKTFCIRSGIHQQSNYRKNVLKNVSLSIASGETIALVGESGCGKTTLGRCLLRFIPTDSGKFHFGGTDMFRLSQKEFFPYRKKIQMIFQDPFQSLNPAISVYSCLSEVIKITGQISKSNIQDEVMKLLDLVHLSPDLLSRKPRNLSGGQRQRLAIARTIAVKPQFLVADEPTSSLDASLKLKIIDLLISLKSRLNLTLLLITHDIALAGYIADKIAVMKNGSLIEYDITKNILLSPKNLYTKLLLKSAGLAFDGSNLRFFNMNAQKPGNYMGNNSCAQ